MQLAPSLHRIGSDMINVYLIEDERGVTLIDAGVSGLWDELVDELESMGRSPSDVRAVILTHADADHTGFAERLRRDFETTVFVHADDAAQATGKTKKKNPPWGKVRIGPLLSFLWYAGTRGGTKVNPIGDVSTVLGGETLDLPGDPTIISTPGHSPGSIAIHSVLVDALFVGDTMTTRHVLTGERGPQPAPFTLDPQQALASLDNWSDVTARWVLPGHGYPWEGGVEEAVSLVRAAAR